MTPHSDEQIIASWRRNAAPWTAAVRGQQIESRRLITDAAIIDAVRGRHPQSVLDVGCGEGWLLRAISAQASIRVGIDVTPELIAAAQVSGGGEFHVASYDDLAQGVLAARFDVVACNFALIGERSVDRLLASVPSLLNPDGAFIVQTLHPRLACGDAPYEDGWRAGSWAGFSNDFRDPAPWYFRTLESWQRLFATHGLRLREQREPLHPLTGQPVSMIFIAEVDAPV